MIEDQDPAQSVYGTVDRASSRERNGAEHEDLETQVCRVHGG